MSADRTAEAVGFIGLGRMGAPMARRLVDAGVRLTVHARSSAASQPFAERGVPVAPSVAALAAGSDVLMTCLSDDAAVRQVMLGAGGAVEAARPGTLFVDLSTVRPSTARAVAAAAQERGCSLLDAGVSGSVPQATAGELVVVAGGDADDLERARPLLDVIGRSVHHMGAGGAGMTAKLAMNLSLVVAMEGLAESICFAQAGGLDLERFLGALADTGVLGAGLKAKLELIRRDEYPASFSLALAAKDVSDVFHESTERHVALPALAAAQQSLLWALAADLGDQDFAVVSRVLRHAGSVDEVSIRGIGQGRADAITS